MIETIIIFLVVIAILIFVHELGHFLVARAFNIRVDEFALGFGPKLWSKKVKSKKHGETLYSINAIPFGGFVKIFGETLDEESMSKHGVDASRSFVHKPRYVQAAVLGAGILFNFIFAWILISGAFMGGVAVASDGYYSKYADRLSDPSVSVVEVAPGSPAEKAGLTPGDIIQSVSGYSGNKITILNIQDAIDASAGKPVTIGYDSGKSVTLSPVKGLIPENPDHYAVGIAMSDDVTLSLPPHLALWEGAKFTGHLMKLTVVGVKNLIVALFQGNHAVLSQVSGPVGIASVVGDAVQIGFSYLVMLTALISINLGVLNLIPFPALDGGRILFVIIEAVMRRPIQPKVANGINTAGFALLILLMVVVTWHDIAKFF